MERTQNAERRRANAAALAGDRRRLAVDAGMLAFLVGLALLFVATAPS